MDPTVDMYPPISNGRYVLVQPSPLSTTETEPTDAIATDGRFVASENGGGENGGGDAEEEEYPDPEVSLEEFMEFGDEAFKTYRCTKQSQFAELPNVASDDDPGMRAKRFMQAMYECCPNVRPEYITYIFEKIGYNLMTINNHMRTKYHMEKKGKWPPFIKESMSAKKRRKNQVKRIPKNPAKGLGCYKCRYIPSGCGQCGHRPGDMEEKPTRAKTGKRAKALAAAEVEEEREDPTEPLPPKRLVRPPRRFEPGPDPRYSKPVRGPHSKKDPAALNQSAVPATPKRTHRVGAYQMFLKVALPRYKKMHPDVEHAEAFKEVVAQWQSSLSEGEKQKYQRIADEANAAAKAPGSSKPKKADKKKAGTTKGSPEPEAQPKRNAHSSSENDTKAKKSTGKKEKRKEKRKEGSGIEDVAGKALKKLLKKSIKQAKKMMKRDLKQSFKKLIKEIL